jgi:hypothetical protein
MKLEHQCVNLELAKKLKELGVEQESYFTWEERGSGYAELFLSKGTSCAHKYYSAFSVAELGELLREIGFMIPPPCKRGESEADIRARLLIDLLENGVKPK